MITLYGIKNCDTVKKARTWLSDNNIEFKFHDFRADGINAQQVERWLKAVGPDILINKKGTSWRGLDATTQQHALKDPISVVVAHPTIVKRPVLEFGATVNIGFKPEQYAALLLK